MVLNDAMEGERGGKREAQAESSFGLIRGSGNMQFNTGIYGTCITLVIF